MSGSDMMYLSSVLLKLSGELHSLTALGRLLNSMGPIDVKKLYLRVLILLLRAFRCGTMHWGPGTRINRGRRGTAISGIWPSRSRYRENDRDNRDKWNPKKTSLKIVFLPFLAGFPCLKQASNSEQHYLFTSTSKVT